MNEDLLTIIQQSIDYHEGWRRFDFFVAQAILWVALLASFGATIAASLDKAKFPRWLLAIMAGLPGLMLMVDNTFHFSARASWGAEYVTALHNMRDEIVIGTVQPREVAQEFAELRKHMDQAWPALSTSAISVSQGQQPRASLSPTPKPEKTP